MAITYDAAKLRELALYIADRSVDDPNFGATKLNKLLFFSDFLAYGQYGAPITGATYRRLQFGPVPAQLGVVQRELLATGTAVVQERDHLGWKQRRLIPLRKPDLSAFTGREIAHVEGIITALWDHSGKAVSDLSHREVLAWKIADTGTVIPYETVFLSVEPPTSADIKRGQELAQEHGWL